MANHAIPQHPRPHRRQPQAGRPWRRGDARPGEADSGRDEPTAAARVRRGEPGGRPGWLVAPATLWLLVFLVVPLASILVFSFFSSTGHGMAPAPTIENYADYFVVEGFLEPESRKFLTPSVFLSTLGTTFRFALTVMVLCLLVGYPIAYFLALQVQSFKWQLALFLLCMVPFWTSYLIRAVAWLPMLGRRGLLNRALVEFGIVDKPVSFLLYSEFGYTMALVQLYVVLCVGPIFFSLAKIDRQVLEAARDMGASAFQIFREIILPLSCRESRSDDLHLRDAHGGVRERGGGVRRQDLDGRHRHPQLLHVRELSVRGRQRPHAHDRDDDRGDHHPAHRRHPETALETPMAVKRRKSAEARRRTLVKSGFGVYFAIFLVFIYGPMFAMFILSFQGKRGGTSFPMKGVSLFWWEKLIEPSTVGDMKGALLRSIILALIVMVITALFSTMLGMAFRRPFRGSGALFYTIMAGLMVPGILLSLGLATLLKQVGIPPNWWSTGLGVHVVWTLPFGSS